MNIEQVAINAPGIRFSYKSESGQEIARARLYILPNDLHARPFGFIEDVYVDESMQGKGIGSQLVTALIASANEHNCYKLICTSRTAKENVHRLYERLGFTKHGLEFRMNF